MQYDFNKKQSSLRSVDIGSEKSVVLDGSKGLPVLARKATR